MVHWDEEGLNSVAKLSDVVEPPCPQKGSKAKVKWGRSIFPATILEIGSKKDVKKEKDFHLEKVTESTQDVDQGIPAKRRKTNEGKKGKGKKMSILCVTEPYSPGSTPVEQCNTPPPADAALLASPLIPTHGIQQDSAASDLMKQVLEKVETLQMALQGVESFVSEQFAAMQVLQDVQSAKVLELQNTLDNLECTAAAVNTSQQFSHLSPGYRSPSKRSPSGCYKCLGAIFRTSDLQHPSSCTIPVEICCRCHWCKQQPTAISSQSWSSGSEASKGKLLW